MRSLLGHLASQAKVVAGRLFPAHQPATHGLLPPGGLLPTAGQAAA